MKTKTKKEKKIRVDITLPEEILRIMKLRAEKEHRTLSAQVAYLAQRQLFEEYWDSFMSAYEHLEELNREEYEKEKGKILQSSWLVEDNPILNGLIDGRLVFVAQKEGLLYMSAGIMDYQAMKEDGCQPINVFRIAEEVRQMKAGKVPDSEISERTGVPPLVLDKFVKVFKRGKPKLPPADKTFARIFKPATGKE